MAPPLDMETLVGRLTKQLESDEYRKSLAAIEQLDVEPYRSFRDARKQMMETKGAERVRQWIKFRLMTPTFDRVSSAMPQFGLSDTDAKLIADYLVDRDRGETIGLSDRFKNAVKSLLPEQPKRRHLALAAGAGFGVAVALWMALALWRRRGSKRAGTKGTLAEG